MFNIEMNDEEKRDILLDMTQYELDEAIACGAVTECEVKRLLPDMFGLLPDIHSIAEVANVIRNNGTLILRMEDDGNISSIPN